MRARVHVAFKDGVLDPQGVAIARALRNLGFPEVRDARQGKLIELELEAADRAQAEARVRAMCEKLLANPVIESYRIEVLDGAP